LKCISSQATAGLVLKRCGVVDDLY
jgi:hypothetical protein